MSEVVPHSYRLRPPESSLRRWTFLVRLLKS